MTDYITYRYWLIGTLMVRDDLHWDDACNQAFLVADEKWWADEDTRRSWEEWDRICGQG